jgi:hypothetical protein
MGWLFGRQSSRKPPSFFKTMMDYTDIAHDLVAQHLQARTARLPVDPVVLSSVVWAVEQRLADGLQPALDSYLIALLDAPHPQDNLGAPLRT